MNRLEAAVPLFHRFPGATVAPRPALHVPDHSVGVHLRDNALTPEAFNSPPECDGSLPRRPIDGIRGVIAILVPPVPVQRHGQSEALRHLLRRRADVVDAPPEPEPAREVGHVAVRTAIVAV